MNQLYCGASRRCITPPAELLPQLRGLKQRRFVGVLDDLYVRAAIFSAGQSSVLLLAFDMTTAPCSEEILQKISVKTGIAVENIFFFSTHTHAVPFNAIDMEQRDMQTEVTLKASTAYTQYLYRETLLAVEEAMHVQQPARMGYAFAESFVNVVRLQDYTYTDEDGRPFCVCNLGADFAKPPDRRLFVMRVESMSGVPILFFANYPMHNVTTIWNDMDGLGAMGVSGDVAGKISYLLETENPGSVAIWSSGAAGDLNPVMINEIILPDTRTGRTYEHKAEGIDFALNCLKIVSERHYADIKNLLHTVLCTEWDVSITSNIEWSVTPGVDCIRHHGAPPEFLQGEGVSEHTVRLQMAQ